MIKLDSILNFFENKLVATKRQYEWDNSGKQIYIENSIIKKIGFALDPSLKVINQAINEGCELLITHHPLFFKGIRNISFNNLSGLKAIKAIQNNLNIVSYHTSLDLADFSLNDYIANLLNAETKDYFILEGEEKFFKFIVFVPETYEDKIIEVIDNSGAGNIGNYSHCTFMSQGTGTFLPNENTNPFIGKKGELEKTKEIKIETIVPKKNLNNLIKAVIKAHPYEEVAYDVYPLELSKKYGLGKICEFKNDIFLEDFFKLVSTKLNVKSIKHNAENLNFRFNKFAIVTGSGASLWKACKTQNVKVLLTGDMKHHEALDAKEEGIIIVDAGHFATEQIFMNKLSEIVKSEFEIDTIIIKEENTIKDWGS